MKWISVKDELPEYKKHVLLVKNNKVLAGWRECTNEKGERYVVSVPDDFVDSDVKISHWMPFPEPLKT